VRDTLASVCSTAQHENGQTDTDARKRAMDESFHVYILASRFRGTMYVGVTNDLSRRVGEHKGGYVPGFTRTYNVNRLVYCEPYASILDARARERTLKRWRREWKFDLIEASNPDWRDLSGEL
jgi:putative endonuclease